MEKQMHDVSVKPALTKPQVERLKQLGRGLRIKYVLGNRVLVKTVIPYTQADEVEKKGLLVIPEHIKKDNTPLPSTGIVVQLGQDAATTTSLIETGSMIMFSKFSGHDFVVDEEDFKILDVSEVMAVLELGEGVDVLPVREEV